MAESLNIRKAFPVLWDLPDEDLAAAPVSKIEKGAGERFFNQGDPGDAVYGVVTGRVEIVKERPDGKDFTLDVFGTGDLVAAVAVLRGTTMPATAIALEPTICLRIDGEWFKETMSRHQEIASRTLDVMMRRLSDAGDARLRLATAPVEARLAAALLRVAEKFGAEHGGEIWIGRSFTRKNLADMAGTTVETTIRVMSRWTKEDWISSHAGRIRIRQPQQLERLNEG